MLTERQYRCATLEINVASGSANGRPLVLLHGVLRCWQDYLTLIPALATRWQVHAVDFRGHGSSQWADGNYLVQDYVGDVVHLLKAHFASQRVLLYGHSLGAMVAAGVAAELPGAIEAVVMEDPPFETLGRDIEQTSFYPQFAGMLALVRRELPFVELLQALHDLPVVDPGSQQTVRLGTVRDAAALRFAARCLTRLDPRVLEPLVAGRWLEGYDPDAVLRRVRCPALLLQADVAAGGMLPDAIAEQAMAALSDGARIRVAGVGHLIHSQQPDATLRWVTNFLCSLPDA